MTRRLLFAPLLATLALQGCWVPQVVQGVQPQIFPSTAPENPILAQVSLDSKQVALATTMVSVSQVAGATYALTGRLAAYRQVLENQLYYNVQDLNSFSGWQYYPDDHQYHSYDTGNGARYTLGFYDRQDQLFTAFDLLGFGSYGPAPQPAQSFPAQVNRYAMSLQRAGFQNGNLFLNLKGVWPEIPLRGGYNTELTGDGSLQGHPFLENLNLRLDGNVLSDLSQVAGQMSFSTQIEGKVYNGFGRFDAQGFVETVDLEQNGIPVLQIQRQGTGWNVLRDQQVIATAR